MLCVTFYIFILKLVLHLLLPSLDHHFSLKKSCYASPCLWNKLPASLRQPNPFLTLLNPVLLAHLSHHHHCHFPSLLLFSTLNSKGTFSLNPSHHKSLPLPSDCLYGYWTAQWFLFSFSPLTFCLVSSVD